MKCSPDGVEFIASWESFRSYPYRDAGRGVWTIGFGHTGPDVGPTTPALDKARAHELLAKDVSAAEMLVLGLGVALAQHEFDALVALAVNVGSALVPATSELARKLQAGHRVEAAREFTKWHFAGGEPKLGLFNRRLAERRLFLTGNYGKG